MGNLFAVINCFRFAHFIVVFASARVIYIHLMYRKNETKFEQNRIACAREPRYGMVIKIVRQLIKISLRK